MMTSESKSVCFARSRLFKLMLLCSLLALWQSAIAVSDNQQNLKSLRERIQALQKDQAEKEITRNKTSDALAEVERNIRSMQQKLAIIKESDLQAKSALAQLEEQFNQLRKSIGTEQHQLDKLTYHQYLVSHQTSNYLKLILNQDDPNQLMRDIHYFDQIARDRTNAIEQLQMHQSQVRMLAIESQQKKQAISLLRVESAAQQKMLEQEKSKHQVLLSQISGQITQQQREINKLQGDEKRLTELVHELNKLLLEKKSKDNVINNKLPDASITGAPFSALKGKLNLPVRGKLMNRFGGQRSGKHVTWKGLFIRSDSGNEVKAISDGTIVFADWLRGFGNLIILDHSNGFMSLYGNNETLLKQVGAHIRGGDTIATVGNSDGDSDSGLYFELRHKGKPIDPMTWITIE